VTTTTEHRIVCRLDELLLERDMTLTAFADLVGITLANASILKNGHARSVRFSTLTKICDVLDCTPGDLLIVEPDIPT
jgi:putative transcriptional regulator